MTSSDQQLPRRCGRYVLFERLGGGGMAEVYKARIAQRSGPERILVIKLLPASCGPHEAARFIEEATIALPLTHGNITATFEFDRHEGRPFLVMEYVHGRSLREILARTQSLGRRVSASDALFVCREVARALRYAHTFVGVDGQRAPIVHRDVSPENVLVSYTGQVKLGDFGIARSVEALDMAGAWGKPAYVAPEILAGDPGGPAADVYSLASVLYEVLSGWPPHLASNDAETLARVRSAVAEPLTVRREDLPEGLAELVARALEKDPTRRGVDASGLEVALSRLLGAVAPHYTEADLAATVVRLFSAELSAEAEGGDARLAGRIRDQLQEAGLATTGQESAAEMLAMGTVALGDAVSSSAAPPAERSGEPASAPGAAQGTAETTPAARVSRAEDLGEPSAGGALLVTAIGLSVLIVGGLIAFFVYGMPIGPPSGGQADGARAAAGDAAAPRPPLVEAGVMASGDAAGRDAGREAAPEPGDGGRAHPPRRRHATVTFNSDPWSYVYVNGQKLPGHTPIRDYKLRPGRHQVRFVNPGLGLSKTTSVRVAPGEDAFVKVRLGPDPSAPSGG